MGELMPRVESDRERRVAEEIWLLYYNNYLFEHGVITESERNHMVSKITARKPVVSESPSVRTLRKQ